MSLKSDIKIGILREDQYTFFFNHISPLLTTNFILFTNQNSFLGQLHSDGGIVSIVRSSAGRHLLVYLSARRLRSSGYYPK